MVVATVERLDQFLEGLQVNKSAIALDVNEVREIDRKLSKDWNIRFPGDAPSLEDVLLALPGDEGVLAFKKAHDYVKKAILDKDVPAQLEAERTLYNALAHPSVFGAVTSKRRHLILDAICIAVGLVRTLGLRGPILDVGCHIGFVSAVLSQVLGTTVTGIDPSEAAINNGALRSNSSQRVTLIQSAIPWETDARFDMALAMDSMPLSANKVAGFLRGLSNLLNPGGLALISSMYWTDADISLTRRQLRSSGFGFGYADVVGGYGSIPLQFEATPTIVLLKGGSREFPRKMLSLSENDWPVFREYSNNALTPIDEKTQAYERAYRRASSSNNQ